MHNCTCNIYQYIGGTDNLKGDEAIPGNSEKKLGDTSLEGMLKAGNLAVHLLPYSSIKGTLHITHYCYYVALFSAELYCLQYIGAIAITPCIKKWSGYMICYTAMLCMCWLCI